MRFKELLEYRRNPEKNVKSISGHHEAIDFLKSMGVKANDKTSNWGISMTELPKLGINPRSIYETPVGIYFYPAWYYLSTVGSGQVLPFQHGAEFIQIFQYDNTKSFDIENYTSDDFERDVDRLNQLYDKNKIKHIVDGVFAGENANTLWRAVRHLSHELTSNRDYRTKINTRVSSIKWNKIFRELGYDLAIDNGNSGIIHPAEPTQGVIFDPRIIKSLKTISNKEELTPKKAYLIAPSGRRIPKLEKFIIQSPEYATYYARNNIGGRWPEAESIIATSDQYSFQYAEGVIHGRFKMGEPAISLNHYLSYYYAKDIIGGRFPLAEKNCFSKESRDNNHWFEAYLNMLNQRDIDTSDLEK